jgi:amidase
VAMMLADYQTSNPIFGRTNNPWDVSRTAGGSSGGAAAAVASGMTSFEVATDFSGSIRIPANFCGVFGLKPTENRVSLMGVVPSPQGEPPRTIRIMSSIGPMARTVDDLELIYGLIAGPDGQDTDVQPIPIDPMPVLELKSLRIAVAASLGGLPVAEAIQQVIEQAAKQISRAGATVEEAELPKLNFNDDLQKAGELIGMIAGGPPDDNTPPIPLIKYFEALDWRDKSIVAWEQFFEQWDVLLCPACMTSAFLHMEQGSPLTVDGHQEAYWSVSAHTTLFNYSGHPAVVIPCQQDADGLPIGIQLVSKRWSESRLLAIAKAVSKVIGGFQKPTGY